MGSCVEERALFGLERLASSLKYWFEMVALGALKDATYLYDPSDNKTQDHVVFYGLPYR